MRTQAEAPQEIRSLISDVIEQHTQLLADHRATIDAQAARIDELERTNREALELLREAGASMAHLGQLVDCMVDTPPDDGEASPG